MLGFLSQDALSTIKMSVPFLCGHWTHKRSLKKRWHLSIYTLSALFCISLILSFQLCGDTENFSNPPADVHNLFQGQVEVHTIRYCNVPLPRGGLISQPLWVCFLWREAAIHRRSWSIIPGTLSFSLLQDSSHFAEHQVQKLQCRSSWPPPHIPLYIFDVFSLLGARELCGEISARVHKKQNSWGVQYLFSSFYSEMSCLDLPTVCCSDKNQSDYNLSFCVVFDLLWMRIFSFRDNCSTKRLINATNSDLCWYFWICIFDFSF